MPSYRVVLAIHGKPIEILADAPNPAHVRVDLDAAWSEGRLCVYRSPGGRRVEIVWGNLAVLDITSITEA